MSSISPTSVDLNAILYSLPTISSDLPPLEPPAEAPSGSDMFIEEDMWSQIEFLRNDRQQELQHLLGEYAAVERANRMDAGWRQIYVRKLPRPSVIPGITALASLEKSLQREAGRAPLIYSSQKSQARSATASVSSSKGTSACMASSMNKASTHSAPPWVIWPTAAN